MLSSISINSLQHKCSQMVNIRQDFPSQVCTKQHFWLSPFSFFLKNFQHHSPSELLKMQSIPRPYTSHLKMEIIETITGHLPNGIWWKIRNETLLLELNYNQLIQICNYLLSLSLRNTGLLASRVSLTSLGAGVSLALVGHSSGESMTIRLLYEVYV